MFAERCTHIAKPIYLTNKVNDLLTSRPSVLVYEDFYARQHICYSAYMPRQFRLSVVCPSVTRVYCVKTAERIIEILLPSDRPVILVFRHQGSLCKSEGVTPNGGPNYKGIEIFDQYAAISRKR